MTVGDLPRPPAKTFEDLVLWQKAYRFVLDTYRLSKGFPKEEMFGLTSQLRRAAVSIPANIVEGFKRRGLQDKVRFLNIAPAPLEECRYYLILTRDLAYGDTQELLYRLVEISKLLDAYCKTNLSRCK